MVQTATLNLLAHYSWTKGIVDGLAFLHGVRIAHFDIKPHNVFIDGTTPKVGGEEL